MLFKVQSAYTSLALQTMHCKSKCGGGGRTQQVCSPPSNRRSIECTCSIYLTKKIHFCNHSLKSLNLIFLWPEHAPRGWGGLKAAPMSSSVHAGGVTAGLVCFCNTLWLEQACRAALPPLTSSRPACVLPSLTAPSWEPNKEKCTVRILMKRSDRGSNHFIL